VTGKRKGPRAGGRFRGSSHLLKPGETEDVPDAVVGTGGKKVPREKTDQ